LTSQPLLEPEKKWFIDGSSFVLKHTHEKVPAGTSAQEAKLTALTRALTLRKGKGSISIPKAYLEIRLPGSTCKERGLFSGR
jgi:hypothetical protein